MSTKVFRWILVVTNLLLILMSLTALILSYFFLIPKIMDEELDRSTTSLSLAFSIWGCVLVLTSICFLGITFTNSCCLHLVAALLLAASAALASWLVTEQFVFREKPNWATVCIALPAAVIWTIQVFTELLMSCVLCCTPSHPKSDAEAAKKAEAEGTTTDDNTVKRSGDDGTDEEKERLVNHQQQDHNSQHGNSHHPAGPGGAFVPSPQAPPIEEVDEGDDDDEDEEEDDEEEADSQAGIRMIDRNNPNHPHDLALRSIPEEKQHLLHGLGGGPIVASGIRPMSRTSQGSGSQQCPLATPEDTGV